MLFDENCASDERAPIPGNGTKNGLSRAKVRRMAQGMPFNLDYNVLYALRRLGYHLELVEDSVSSKFQP